MKKIFIILIFLTINQIYSQSIYSILGKTGGQLLQDISNDKNIKVIGKAIETAGEMVYDIEKIEARNKKIIVRTLPDKSKKIFPIEGYKWKYSSAPHDYTVEKYSNSYYTSHETSMDLFNQSLQYFNNNKIDLAETFANKSIEIEPNFKSFYVLFLCYFERNQLDKASEYLGNILNFDLDNDWFSLIYLNQSDVNIKKGNNLEAINICNTALNNLELSSELKAIVYGNKGTAEFNIGDLNNALSDLNTAMNFDFNFEFLYLNRGLVLQNLKNYDDAFSDYEKCINICELNSTKTLYLKKNESIAYANCAHILLIKQNYQSALSYSNKSIEFDPNNAFGFFVRGASKFELGFKEGACLDLRKAKEMGLNPNQVEVVTKLCNQ